MDPIEQTKRELEQLIGISDSDADMFWSLSKKCSVLALAPTVAVGVSYGPALTAAGTTFLPGIGTVSGATATLLMMGGTFGASYAACMSLLPKLIELRDQLRNDASARFAIRQDVQRLLRSG